MNKNQINRKEMLDAVLSYLDANVEKWSPIPKVGEFKNELTALKDSIEAAQEAQQSANVKVGKNLKKLKHTISQKTDIINDAVEAYAVVTENPELESRMASSAWEINRLRKEDFVVKVKEVVTEAENHKEVLLAEYGLTEEQLVDLKTDLNNYLVQRGMPRAYQISSSQATKDIESTINQAMATLDKKMDKVMKLFKRRDANFYNGYVAARVIVDD